MTLPGYGPAPQPEPDRPPERLVVPRPPLWMRLFMPRRAERRQRELIGEAAGKLMHAHHPPTSLQAMQSGLMPPSGPRRRPPRKGPGPPPAGVREPRKPKPSAGSGMAEKL